MTPLAAAFGLWGMLELGLVIRDGRPIDRGLDQRTRQYLFFSFAAALAIALPLSLLPVLHLPWPGALALIGTALILGGAGLRLWAVLTLGRYFRLSVTVDDNQPVITSGPFRFVRHPSYVAMLICLFGLGLGLGSLLSVVIPLAMAVPAVLRRIDVEEGALRDGLGAAYDSYCDRTRRLIPGLW